MILFGHSFIQNTSFFHVTSIDAISSTPPSSMLFLEFQKENLEIIDHLQRNHIKFALYVKSITQVIYAANLGTSFIVLDKALAKTAQNIAENYLFDAKILAKIDTDEEIEEMALLNIDGVIYPNAIIKINS